MTDTETDGDRHFWNGSGKERLINSDLFTSGSNQNGSAMR